MVETSSIYGKHIKRTTGYRAIDTAIASDLRIITHTA